MARDFPQPLCSKERKEVSKSSEASILEPLQDVAYTHDGTLEGVLSAVFSAYERHEDPTDIVAARLYRPRLGQSRIPIATDTDRALRVRRGLQGKGGVEAFRLVLHGSLCDDYDAGTTILRFTRALMDAPSPKVGKRLIGDWGHPAVAPLRALSRKALNEAERMRQFLRFSALEQGIWFARCNPSVSVIPLVMGHFASRFGNQPFIIYDEVHLLSGIYDGSSWSLVVGDIADIPAPAAQDGLMEEAWRRFYDALSVDARYNPELRRNFMPMRLWKNLPEMKPSGPVADGRFLNP